MGEFAGGIVVDKEGGLPYGSEGDWQGVMLCTSTKRAKVLPRVCCMQRFKSRFLHNVRGNSDPVSMRLCARRCTVDY